MNHRSLFHQWYEPPVDILPGAKLSVVEAAFVDAKAKFEHDSKGDAHTLELTRSKTSIDEVQAAVQHACSRYDSNQQDSKARKWLNRLSQRLHFYGGVLDVIAQHHPEYVALAWGSIKFFLVAAINHEKIIRTLAKAITLFAEALPRVDLQSSLYPTKAMKEAVTQLYVSIFQFLARARQWYQCNGILRLYHSMVHPVELQYNDLLQDVVDCSQTIDRLSSSGAKAETRDMHRIMRAMQVESRENQRLMQAMQAESQDNRTKLQNLLNIVENINGITSLTSTICLNTNNVVTDIQLNQMMDTLLVVAIMDPTKTFQYHCSLRRQRWRSAATQSVTDKFWQSPKLRNWSSTPNSALAIVSGNYRARYVVRDFCVDVIEQLKNANIPALLALKVPGEEDAQKGISMIDVLKYLVRQAMISRKEHSEKGLALRCASLHNARTEAEWFQLFEEILSDICRLVYIIVDLDPLDRHLEPTHGAIWVQCFQSMFASLTRRGIETKVKVVLVSCSPLRLQLTDADHAEFVVQAKTKAMTTRQRKSKQSASNVEGAISIEQCMNSLAQSVEIGLTQSVFERLATRRVLDSAGRIRFKRFLVACPSRSV